MLPENGVIGYLVALIETSWETGNLHFASLVALGVWITLLAWFLTTRYYEMAASVPPAAKHAAQRFVDEFARPLVRHDLTGPPIRARVRFLSSGQRFDISLKPAVGRRYPNLSDHRANVEYDVERVLQLLGNEVARGGPLRAEGEWVVIPIRWSAGKTHTGAI
jgi:hypothetical protein